MRAWHVTESTKSPILLDSNIPEIATNEILVDVHACGLNFADLLMIRGTYQETPPVPFVLGLECAGRINSVGADVPGLEPGTAVVCFGGPGALAEQAVFPADRCLPLPDGFDMVTAAGLMIAYGTSHLALMDRAKVTERDRVLVTGAAGGVGLTAVEIAAAQGAEVIAVARGAEKCAIAKQAGAAHAFDSDQPDLLEAIKAIGRVDVVYDAVGGALFDVALRACNRGARYLVIGFAGGDVPKIPANIIMVKNITVFGLYWGGVFELEPDRVRASLAEVFDWVATGKLNPAINHVYEFEDALEALQLLKDRKSTGKVVVKTR